MVDNVMKVASHPITTSLPAVPACDSLSVCDQSGRIHGKLVRVMHHIADKKTARFFQQEDYPVLADKKTLGPLNDVSTESYRASSSGTLAHLCANFGLASAQAAPFCTQVVGHSVRRSARAFVNGTGQSRLHS